MGVLGLTTGEPALLDLKLSGASCMGEVNFRGVASSELDVSVLACPVDSSMSPRILDSSSDVVYTLSSTDFDDESTPVGFTPRDDEVVLPF